MSATLPDPAQVRVGGGVILLVTWCCRRQVRLPKEHTDLVLTQQVVCPGCKSVGQVDIVSEPREGLRAVWSTSPDLHPAQNCRHSHPRKKRSEPSSPRPPGVLPLDPPVDVQRSTNTRPSVDRRP